MAHWLWIAALFAPTVLHAQNQRPAPSTVAQPDMSRFDYGLRPRALGPGVWVIEGAVDDFRTANGCNIINTGFVDTPQGLVIINTGPSLRYGRQQRQAVAHASGQRPVSRVLNLNLHPDYFFGNQAWSDVPVLALSGSIDGMKREGGAYADNLYALCLDWMRDTESTPARQALAEPLGQRWPQADSRLELLHLSGHTGDDLVVIDHASGVVFVGGLAFAERIPTTPHADLPRWLASLDKLEHRLKQLPSVVLVPSHGPVYPDLRAITQTRDYLQWLDAFLTQSAQQGLDISEVLASPLPKRFADWAAGRAEYARNVTHLYPRYETMVLKDSAGRN